VKPRPFEYLAPSSLDEALGQLAERGDRARVLAGGQSLVPLLNLRLASPEALIDLNRIGSLAFVEEREGGIAVGAMTRQRELERSSLVRDRMPLLPAALRHVAHFQIRNRGTVGGSVAHADAAAELPALLRAMDGHVIARSARGGERRISAGELFDRHLTTSMSPDEILTEVFFPDLPSRSGWGFHEFAKRHGDTALAGAAAIVAIREGRIASAAIALLGAAGTPMRALRTERALTDTAVTDDIGAAVQETVREEVDPVADVHGSAEYRRYLAGVVARRAIADAIERAPR